MGEAVNRRDFIGAAIGALVAALLLPFEEFAAWARAWLTGERLREVSESVLFCTGVTWNFAPGSILEFEGLSWRVTKVDHRRGTITVST